MNLVGIDGDKSVFHLSGLEKRLLFDLLKLYPLVPAAHHQLSRSADPKQIAADQKLLDEAVAEQRRQNQRQLMAMLADERRFSAVEGGFQFTLTGAQVECLLQVLNDIRVGSWLILGQPGADRDKPVKLTSHQALHHAALEFCGYLQMSLLEAFEESA